jgi:hypothetical protein
MDEEVGLSSHTIAEESLPAVKEFKK